ncbi:hypothetical protein ACFSFW_18665 [Fredinandcohnia salidurans]|uniref:Uncharacterized protein n=1 Tax=Fredinandcohnia salidurans TaxID=2595041 RepID=A0ABW4MRT5_9BACI
MVTIGIDFNRVLENFYKKENHKIIINETQDSGKAELEVIFPNLPNISYYKLEEEKTQWLKFINNQKCADGVVLQINESQNRHAIIYIFELKSTLSSSTWSKVLKQYRGALLRAISFCNVVGISDIREVYLYTSFTDSSKLDSEKKAIESQQNVKGLIAKKRFVGLKSEEILKWGNTNIKLFPNGGYFPHQKITLRHVNGVNTGSFIV